MRIDTLLRPKHDNIDAIVGREAIQWTIDRADELFQVIKENDGMTRTEIQAFFDRNASRDTIACVLALLAWAGRIEQQRVTTTGRPVERWVMKEG